MLLDEALLPAYVDVPTVPYMGLRSGSELVLAWAAQLTRVVKIMVDVKNIILRADKRQVNSNSTGKRSVRLGTELTFPSADSDHFTSLLAYSLTYIQKKELDVLRDEESAVVHRSKNGGFS